MLTQEVCSYYNNNNNKTNVLIKWWYIAKVLNANIIYRRLLIGFNGFFNDCLKQQFS